MARNAGTDNWAFSIFYKACHDSIDIKEDVRDFLLTKGPSVEANHEVKSTKR